MILSLVAVLVGIIFWWQLFLGKLPIPLDVLVGVYHPWADRFWGFVAGVPYKNFSLSDVFSQLYPWRLAVVDLWSKFSFPLWNPYSFAGYPLAANWQSAPFFPLNALLLLFGKVWGYGLLVALQPILSLVFMVGYLRQIKLSKAASLIGAISFAFGGYMMTYLTWATTGYILAFIPAGLYLIEKYLSRGKRRYLFWLSGIVFLILTGGFFQPAFFALLIIGAYAAVACYRQKNLKELFPVLLFLSLGIGLAAIQLLPTLELLSLSIRKVDHNIDEYNFGLLPIKHLITFLAPDFFGNPATGNYFGPIQYQEASGYFGVIGLILAIAGFFAKKKNWRQFFFVGFFILSLVLIYDGPIGRAVFSMKIPLISTGYASRWLMVTALAGSILAAFGLETIEKKNKLSLALLSLGLLVGLYFLSNNPVSSRNLILPIALVASATVLLALPRNKIFIIPLILLVSFDLLRYGWKFTPMVNPEYGAAQIPILQKTKELAGINRVTFDQGPVVPANTWMLYQIQTIGGYDPLLYKDFGIWFRALNIGINPNQRIDGSLAEGAMTRYLNLFNPYSPLLDLVGVKYFMTLKIDKVGQYSKEGEINKELLKKYAVIDEYGATVLLENKSAMPRFSLFYEAEVEPDWVKATEKLVAGFDFRTKILLSGGEPERLTPGQDDTVELLQYEANEIRLRGKTENGGYLLLTDTDYPGWRAEINGKPVEIIRANGIFRAVKLPAGESIVRFFYFPNSFRYGLAISGASVLGLLAAAIYFKQKRQV